MHFPSKFDFLKVLFFNHHHIDTNYCRKDFSQQRYSDHMSEIHNDLSFQLGRTML